MGVGLLTETKQEAAELTFVQAVTKYFTMIKIKVSV